MEEMRVAPCDVDGEKRMQGLCPWERTEHSLNSRRTITLISEPRLLTKTFLRIPHLPMSLRFIPHIIYSLTLTSFSMHLLYERRATEEDRAHYSGKISILETLVQDLERGRTTDPREVERLRKLAGLSTSHVPEINRNQSRIGWKEVFLGKALSEQTLNGSALRDQGDLEKRG